MSEDRLRQIFFYTREFSEVEVPSVVSHIDLLLGSTASLQKSAVCYRTSISTEHDKGNIFVNPPETAFII